MKCLSERLMSVYMNAEPVTWVDFRELSFDVLKLEAAIEACRLYLKTGTPFARAALERALEELE